MATYYIDTTSITTEESFNQPEFTLSINVKPNGINSSSLGTPDITVTPIVQPIGIDSLGIGSPRPKKTYPNTKAFYQTLSEKIGEKTATPGNSKYLIERMGGKIIETAINEPDPNTCRNDYYYNSRINILYKKMKNNNDKNHYWKAVSSQLL